MKQMTLWYFFQLLCTGEYSSKKNAEGLDNRIAEIRSKNLILHAPMYESYSAFNPLNADVM